MADTLKLILDFLKRKGPSLPIHIAKEADMNTLFAGAYLSELFKEKELKISDMKVGSSPLYYLEGQEELLGNFTQHLPSKEKEAHDLLKKNGILEDTKQTPAIRVALRNIKDFAIPYKIDNKVIWRYMISEKPLELIEETKSIKKQPTKKTASRTPQKSSSKPTITAEQLKEQAEKEIEKELIEETKKDIQEPEEIEKSDIIEEIEETPKPIPVPKKLTKKPKKLTPKDKFLQQIKNYLEKKGVDIIEIEKHDKKQIAARVKIKDQAYLLMAFNKKRFDESDLLKAYRKYNDEEIPFYFLSKGELSKKTEETIRAAKQLKAIGIFEE